MWHYKIDANVLRKVNKCKQGTVYFNVKAELSMITFCFRWQHLYVYACEFICIFADCGHIEHTLNDSLFKMNCTCFTSISKSVSVLY